MPGQAGKSCNSRCGDWLRGGERKCPPGGITMTNICSDGDRGPDLDERARQPGQSVGAEKALLTLGAHSPRNTTSARFSKVLELELSRRIRKTRRTFGRRGRHMSVGRFQRPMPNGRRQAMIFRLRGVALFQASIRCVPAEWKRQERPRQLIVVGGLPRLLLWRLCERRRRRRSQRQAQTCTLQIHCGRPSPSIVFKIRVSLEITARPQSGALILKSHTV